MILRAKRAKDKEAKEKAEGTPAAEGGVATTAPKAATGGASRIPTEVKAGHPLLPIDGTTKRQYSTFSRPVFFPLPSSPSYFRLQPPPRVVPHLPSSTSRIAQRGLHLVPHVR